YKEFLNQIEIKNEVASHILKNNDIKVDVHNPELTINIDIYDKNFSYVWFNKIYGIGGLPIGLNGSCLSLLSGGIDSPVASFLLQKKGQKVDYLTFITDSVTEKTILKLKNLIKTITLNYKLYTPKFFIVDFTKVQHELIHISNEKYRITLMRRSFYRIAQMIANKFNYNALVCGDSLGQVASQTIESIGVISQVCNNIQIFRPLLAFDKIEIIKIAKEIKTYDISVSEHEDVCSMFAPKQPITRPKLNVAINLENELQLLNDLESMAVKNVKITKDKIC
ncbi:MAG: tRNA 4-thiouridine(8) synthase ThiI, partial [Malacoplasma sp.]|nr:tRNA 4-thiouridine(8) synthase ThiI [Malacoplasma sp.]